MKRFCCSRRDFISASAIACAMALPALCGCVDQHPYKDRENGNPRLVATSAAVMDVCDRLELELVGIPKTDHTIPMRYQGLPEVGMPMAPDVEILSSLHPDYVLSPNTLLDDLRPKYAAVGVASIFLDMRSVDGLYDSVRYLGRKFHREDQAAELDSTYRAFLDEFETSIAGFDHLRVLVLMGVPGSYLVATEKSYVGSLVEQAGGRNIYAGSGREFLNVNTEDMQAKDPDVILRCAHALPDDVKQMFAEEFKTNDIWQHFSAVQAGRVYDLSYENFGMSASFGYPDAFAELRQYLYGDHSLTGQGVAV